MRACGFKHSYQSFLDTHGGCPLSLTNWTRCHSYPHDLTPPPLPPIPQLLALGESWTPAEAFLDNSSLSSEHWSLRCVPAACNPLYGFHPQSKTVQQMSARFMGYRHWKDHQSGFNHPNGRFRQCRGTTNLVASAGGMLGSRTACMPSNTAFVERAPLQAVS